MEQNGTPRVEPDGWYTTEEVAHLLDVSVSSIRQWRSRSVGPSYYKLKRSRECRYKGVDIINWERENAQRVETNTAAEPEAQ